MSEESLCFHQAEQIAIDKLLAIAAPEAILSLHDDELTRRYFSQANSSMVNFLERELRDVPLMLFVTTYSPLDIELEHSLSSFLRNREIGLKFIQLHEMRTSTDLNRAIDEFMKTDEEESMLVLVCDPIATRYLFYLTLQLTIMSSFQRIQFAQYECERKRDNRKKRHVIILVNLMRGHKFTFDFDRRWRYVFIDDVREGTNVGDMTCHSLSEILKKADVGKVITDNLHHSLSRLVYPYSRTSSVSGNI